MINPLVSICIPAYNVESYIANTIDSVLSQTYRNIEIIVVNDGSSDGTASIIEQKASINNLKILHQENKGAAAARNQAYKKSKGQFIKFLDGDDLIGPGMIELQVKRAIDNENSIISGKWGRFYNDDLSTFKLNPEECWQTMKPGDWICSSWKNGKSMTQSGIFLIPRSIIDRAGLWNESLTLIDDLDFFTRTILKSQSVVFEEDAILFYRSGIKGNLSGKKDNEAIESAYRSILNATQCLLDFDNSKESRQACANVWQNFVYSFYPGYPHYIAEANERIKDLGGSNLPFACGGLTRIFVRLFGWKIAVKIKSF